MITRLTNIYALYKDVGGFNGFFGKVFKVVKEQGIAGAYSKGKYIIVQSKYRYRAAVQMSYREWMEQYDILSASDVALLRDKIDTFQIRPLLSVVMPVFNSNNTYLEAAIQSVRNQIYTNWELCIADDASTTKDHYPVLKKYQSIDPRIKVVFRSENGHISQASNSALDVA
jgi:hypothetical protein